MLKKTNLVILTVTGLLALAGSGLGSGPVGAQSSVGALAATGTTTPQPSAGTARDAGEVNPTTPGFNMQGLVGWQSVTRAGTGEYCLTPDGTSTKANTSLLVTTGGPGGGGKGIAVWDGYCSSSTFELKVDTYTWLGVATDKVYFEAAVPSATTTAVGATSSQGPEGMARDAGSVYPVTPSLYAEGHAGWASVTRADVGEYCLTPEATTTFDNTTLLLSTGGPGGGGTPGIAIWAGYCSSDALELKVETSTLSGVPSNSIPFEAVIPSVAQGSQVPAGSVPDAGYFSLNGDFLTEGLVGWRSVTSPGTGRYCLTPGPTASAANTLLLLSTGVSGGTQQSVAIWDGYCSMDPLELEVDTYSTSGAIEGTIPFEAVALLAGSTATGLTTTTTATTTPKVSVATARDAGEVDPATPTFYAQGLVGWRLVTRAGLGEYCLTPDATSTKAGTSLFVSTGGPVGGGDGLAVWDGYCSTSPFELKVDTRAWSGAASDQVQFEAVVPSTGATSPAGLAAMARDAASVFPVTPSFYAEGRAGWASVTRRGQGEYCLTPDGSSTVAGTGLLVSAGGPGGAGAQGFAIWAGYCSSSPLELEVDTYALSGAASDGVPFEAVIPSAPVGAQAPAGTVPDAGVVSVKYPTPAFSSAALVGWRSVSTAATGRYCLTPDRASTFSNTSLLLSVLQPGEAVWAGYCSTNPVELKVDTYALSGTASGTVAFMAVVNQVPPGTGSTCPACGANLIVNGNFSRPVVNGYDTISASAQGLPGWTVGGDSVDVIGRAFWPPPPGSPRASQSIDLSGGAPGRITQAVLTAPGSRYLLKWYGAGNYGCGQSPKVMHVWWDRKLVAAPTMSTTGQNSSSMAWSPESQVVTASSARSVLEFADATPDKSSCGAVVADVSLTPDHN